MPRNGTGVYSLPPGINPVKPNTLIQSSWANATLNDLAAAITRSLAADGQTAWTGSQNAAGNSIKNLGDPTDPGDAVPLRYLDLKAFDRIGISGVQRPTSGTFAPMVKTGDYSVQIPGGSGFVINPLLGSTSVEWSQQEIVLSTVSSHWQTTIGIDSSGNIEQLGGPILEEWSREYIILGHIAHPKGIITNIINAPSILGSSAYAMYDVASALRDEVLEGGRVLPNALDGLAVDIEPRKVFYFGGSPNSLSSNYVEFPLESGITMYPVTGNGTVGDPVTALPVTKYNPAGGGTVEDIPGAASVTTVMRLYRLAGAYFLLYGQKYYETMADAAAKLASELVVFPSKLEGSSHVATFLVTKSATSLAIPEDVFIISNPGQGGGGGGGPSVGGATIPSFRVIYISESLTLDASYANCLLVSTSVTPITLTARENDGDEDLDWVDGAFVMVAQLGAGHVTFAGSTAPTGFQSRTRSVGSTASFTCLSPGTNQWLASGDLYRPASLVIKESWTIPDRLVLPNANVSANSSIRANYFAAYNFVLDPISEFGVVASLNVPQVSGNALRVDVLVNGTSILSSKLTIDNGTKHSGVSAVPAVYSPAFVSSGHLIPAGSEVTYLVTQSGTAAARALVLTLKGSQST